VYRSPPFDESAPMAALLQPVPMLLCPFPISSQICTSKIYMNMYNICTLFLPFTAAFYACAGARAHNLRYRAVFICITYIKNKNKRERVDTKKEKEGYRYIFLVRGGHATIENAAIDMIRVWWLCAVSPPATPC
jgi:hypothetical protein